MILLRNNLIKHKKVYFLFLVLAFLFFRGADVFASSLPCAQRNITGWAWSGNVGWISFACENEFSIGTGVDYGVNVNEGTGVMSGHAWSGNIGWISFNIADLSGCPSGECRAHINFQTGNITGWARVVSTQEWISFSGSNYQTTIIGNDFHGWAWSNGIVGWVSFNCLNTNHCLSSDYRVRAIRSLGETLFVITRPATRTTSQDGMSAVLVGNLLNTGGVTNNSVWFEHGTTTGGMTRNVNTIQTRSNAGVFSSAINFVSPQFGITHFFRAVAENTQGTSFGETLSFTIKRSSSLITIKHAGKERRITINSEGIIEIVQ